MSRFHRPALVAGLLFALLYPTGALARGGEDPLPVGAPGAEPVEIPTEKSEYQQGLEATWAGDYEGARGHYEAHLAQVPGDAQAILSLARVEFWTNRYAESIALYDQYLVLQPHDVDAQVELAHSLFWAGDLVRTETTARGAVAVEPENIKANLVLAAVLQSTDRKKEADEVYDWVLKVDPDNVNAKNRQTLARPAPEPGEAFVLTSKNLLYGDNFDFFGFKSTTGLGMGVFGFLTLEPQLHVRVIDDKRVKSPYTGVGPGLKVGVNTGTPVSIWAGGAYVPMMGQGTTVHGWSAGAGVSVRFNEPELSLWGSFNTELHGLERQSAFAVEEGYRRYEGLLGLYYAPDWFRLVASGSLGRVFDRFNDPLNMSWWVSPAFRVHDGRWKVYIGYGFWGMVYQRKAPPVDPAAPESGQAYWDPAAALSHTLYLDLDAQLHANWKLYANLGGGLAQERDRSTTTTPASWTVAGLVNGQLGFGWSPSAAFEARLGSGLSMSSRGSRPYTTWNVLLDLIGRW
ncbi:MAG: tetratricopeptide repeat protein [Pseudomonadota bacterium]